MPVTVKKVVLWRRELDNRPGALATVLAPLAEAGADLQIAMGYRFPGNETRAAVELAPVSGKKSAAAAQRAGLQPYTIPTLLVTGDNRPGLGYALSRGMAEAGINMAFLVAQVLGRKYSAVFGFESEGDADRAVAVIKQAAKAKKRRH
jgi:prephenate dehydratase